MSEMEKARGCRMILGDRAYSRRTEMFYFLSVFHPELSLEERLEIANEQAHGE
jgi:hypothetical protein